MPEFKDVAEAKKAMLEVFTALQGNKTEIEAAVTAAGDDLQKKMMTVIPLLQNTLAGPLATYGFPAGGPGIMAGIGAFTKASLTEGEPSVLKEGAASSRLTNAPAPIFTPPSSQNWSLTRSDALSALRFPLSRCSPLACRDGYAQTENDGFAGGR